MGVSGTVTRVAAEETAPAANAAYWISKLDRNKARFRQNKDLLRRQGRDVLVLWECELGPTKGLGS
jgi:G:T-mismatch repair DNA endonuclease (very short patch repair protein)